VVTAAVEPLVTAALDPVLAVPVVPLVAVPLVAPETAVVEDTAADVAAALVIALVDELLIVDVVVVVVVWCNLNGGIIKTPKKISKRITTFWKKKLLNVNETTMVMTSISTKNLPSEHLPPQCRLSNEKIQ